MDSFSTSEMNAKHAGVFIAGHASVVRPLVEVVSLDVFAGNFNDP